MSKQKQPCPKEAYLLEYFGLKEFYEDSPLHVNMGILADLLYGFEQSLAFNSNELGAENEKLKAENNALKSRVPIIEIDPEVMQMLTDMYKRGDKLTAIKWLVEESRSAQNTFGIKWAHEYFQKIGLEAVKED